MCGARQVCSAVSLLICGPVSEWVIWRSFLFLNYLKSYFKFYALKRQRIHGRRQGNEEGVRNRSISYPLVTLLNAWQQLRLRQAEARSRELNPGLLRGGRPKHLSQHYYYGMPGCALAGSWTWEWSWSLHSGSLIWDAQVAP